MLSELRQGTPEGCVSDLDLDELHAGDLEAGRREQVEQHLQICDRCSERQRAMQAVASGFLAHYPAPPGVRQSRGIRRIYAKIASTLALAAVIVLFVHAQRPPSDDPIERSKGGARLGFYIKRDARVFPGADGERVRAGDQLRFAVTNGAGREIAILSRDGNGAASVYYPAQPRSRALGSERETVLDAAVQLDATPGTESLFGIFCASPFELEPVRAALEKTGHLPALPGCTVDEMRVTKDPP